MRSAASSILGRGRHRWGRPGLVHVSAFVAVAHRGLLASWRTPGRHRRHAWVPSAAKPKAEPIPAL